MDMNVNRAREAKPVQAATATPAQSPTTAPAATRTNEKDSTLLEKIKILDQGPDFGKIGKVPGSIELPHDPLPPTPAEKVVDKALGEFHFNRIPLHAGEEGPMKPFAERKQEFVDKLVKNLNQTVGKSNKYEFSNKDLKIEVQRLKDEINKINHDLASGMTDCWGSLTNHKIECQMAIDAIEQALDQRKMTNILKPLEPKVQICGPFPWEKPGFDGPILEKQPGQKGEPKNESPHGVHDDSVFMGDIIKELK